VGRRFAKCHVRTRVKILEEKDGNDRERGKEAVERVEEKSKIENK
jgi:hypothetical protein